MNIKIYTPETEEYLRLETAAFLLTKYSRKGITYTVINTYFDFGQDWKWTTLLATRPDGQHYQALCPRDHEKILTYENIFKAIHEIITDKYWTDK